METGKIEIIVCQHLMRCPMAMKKSDEYPEIPIPDTDKDYVVLCRTCFSLVLFDLRDTKKGMCSEGHRSHDGGGMGCEYHPECYWIECAKKHFIPVSTVRGVFFDGVPDMEVIKLFCSGCGERYDHEGKCKCS